ncbi:hypothetical protein SAZ10_19465 [Mesorhizobium sp. BAC0120]|uniref:hypothetical protein n=1 Tax=Mesorhizobium sp. BAC0120 TaxID=3090670 RepID=UPI00298C244A|nr:hypothetical protein [Mesorhizobium sp. BAC0120]MDW6023929.1 hypothetical protein [Mesorhizobium sp. BAC0120]
MLKSPAHPASVSLPHLVPGSGQAEDGPPERSSSFFATSLTALIVLRALYGITMGGELGVGA